MSHDLVRGQSVAETCFSHWGYYFPWMGFAVKFAAGSMAGDISPSLTGSYMNQARLYGKIAIPVHIEVNFFITTI